MRFTPEQAEAANSLCHQTLESRLGIVFSVDQEGRLCASMPVDDRTRQTMGMLHGGATAALAESLGSVGSYLLVRDEGLAVVGVEVNANHLRGVREGTVTGTGTLVHKGRSTHVWDIRVTGPKGELCAICRLTLIVLKAS
jgi:1,4-dihydroxy-2-naphthoyl-CoA hydrolase